MLHAFYTLWVLSVTVCALVAVFNKEELADMIKELAAERPLFSDKTLLVILYITFVVPFLNTYIAYLVISGMLEDLFSKE